MKKKWYKQVVLWLLVMVVVVVPTFGAEVVRANLSFDQMKYEHMEYKDIEGLIREAEKLIKVKDTEGLYKWQQNYYSEYCKLQTMIQISHLSYELNTDRNDYFKEYLYSVDLLGKMKSAYINLFEDKDTTLSDDMNTYYTLSIEREKLVDEYYSQENKVKIDVNGEQLGVVQIIKSQTLNNDEKLKKYDDWLGAYNHATGEIFLKLIKIDNQVAKINGYDTYAEYMYHSYGRDYTLEDSKVFIGQVKKVVPSILKKIDKKNVSESSKLIEYNFKDEKTLLENVNANFISKHKELEEVYEYLTKYQLYDITSRQNKESGGFTMYFESFKEPFILLNYSKPYETVLSFIHEFGHYTAYYKIGANEGGLDLDETYSQALELLAMPSYEKILGNKDYATGASTYTVEAMVNAIIDGCLYDEFLQQAYEMPDLTVEKMNQLYTKLAREYGLDVDGRGWCDISHNFEQPFYYLSYSVSAVAALEVWEKSLTDEKSGMDTYFKLIDAGKENTFIKALEETGLSNPMEKATLERVMKAIADYFELDGAQTLKQAA